VSTIAPAGKRKAAVGERMHIGRTGGCLDPGQHLVCLDGHLGRNALGAVIDARRLLEQLDLGI
jgi:hypothetical protein